jgi:hypothetical protein
MKDIVSLNEKEFIIEALHSRVRIDGRAMYDYRAVSFHFGKVRGNVEVHLGGTRVYCSVIAEGNQLIHLIVVQPRPDKPTEGIFYFDINFSPIADPGFDGRTPEQAIEVARVIEKGLKESKAIDAEELCILAGAQVWSIRVMLTVLVRQSSSFYFSSPSVFPPHSVPTRTTTGIYATQQVSPLSQACWTFGDQMSQWLGTQLQCKFVHQLPLVCTCSFVRLPSSFLILLILFLFLFLLLSPLLFLPLPSSSYLPNLTLPVTTSASESQ